MKLKLLYRFRMVVLSSANNLLVPFGNMLVSFLLLRYKPVDFYGELAYLLILFDFAFNIISWGNKDFLLRAFSLQPAQIKNNWQQAFYSRSPLLLVFLLILLFTHYSVPVKCCFVLWLPARYLYRSFDALFQFHRRFGMQLLVETAGLVIIIVPVVCYRQQLDLATLLLYYTISHILKCIFCLGYFRKEMAGIPQKLQAFHYFAAAFPFLLLTFSGMLQARADVYSVAYFLNKEDLAQYQVLSGFLGFAQLSASLLLVPFGKNIFRLHAPALKRLARNFAAWGLVISAMLVTMIYIIVHYIYRMPLDIHLYYTGYFYILPVFFYLPYIYRCSRQNKQMLTIFITLGSSGINILLSCWLTPRLMKEGALIAATLTQWSMVLLFKLLINKKITFATLKW